MSCFSQFIWSDYLKRNEPGCVGFDQVLAFVAISNKPYHEIDVTRPHRVSCLEIKLFSGIVIFSCIFYHFLALMWYRLKFNLKKTRTCLNIMLDHDLTISFAINSSHSGQNGRHFADDIFKCIFLTENVCILIAFHWSFLLRVQLTISEHWFR